MNKLPDGIVMRKMGTEFPKCKDCIGQRAGSKMCMPLPPCTSIHFPEGVQNVIFVKDERHV